MKFGLWDHVDQSDLPLAELFATEIMPKLSKL